MKSRIPFDQRDGYLWYNGKLVPWSEVKIHPLNHGMSYGSSIFEGERVYNGVIFKSLEHSKRLFHSAKLMNMNIDFTLEEIEKAKKTCVQKNNINFGYMKVMAWRGSEDLTVFGKETSINIIISVWNVGESYNDKNQKQGVKLGISKWRRAPGNSFPYQAKIGGGYVINTLAKHEAEKRSLDDALLLDHEGNIAEASSSNFFAVKNNKLYTPIADCFLNGITRQTVIKIAQDKGFEVEEAKIHPDDLESFDEVFLTGTAAEIIPVIQIEKNNFKIGNITNFLIKEYKKAVSLT
ncbi:MAG: branched-chain amino acid transaminase [Rickettsiales bacterium]